MKWLVSTFTAAMLMAAAAPAIADHSADGNVYQRWLHVHNETNYDICYFYASHVDARNWGPDLLGPCIPPGYYQTVDPGWQQGYCMMDIKYEYEDGSYGTDVINICEVTDYYIVY